MNDPTSASALRANFSMWQASGMKYTNSFVVGWEKGLHKESNDVLILHPSCRMTSMLATATSDVTLITLRLCKEQIFRACEISPTTMFEVGWSHRTWLYANSNKLAINGQCIHEIVFFTAIFFVLVSLFIHFFNMSIKEINATILITQGPIFSTDDITYVNINLDTATVTTTTTVKSVRGSNRHCFSFFRDVFLFFLRFRLRSLRIHFDGFLVRFLPLIVVSVPFVVCSVVADVDAGFTNTIIVSASDVEDYLQTL